MIRAAEDVGRLLVQALAPGRVLEDDATLDRYARTTLTAGTRPRWVCRPTCRDEVQAVIRLAGAHGLAIHPVSRGCNWGYGDRCAGRDGCLVLDLALMDRIVAIDPDLAYAVVEPGVSQGQLQRHFATHHPHLMLDASGAGPDASIVGTLAERGFGHSRLGDRIAHSCDLEVVLGTGEVVRTGMGAWAGSRTAALQAHGLGPALQGLFTQSALGIITRATVWLMPRPERLVTALILARHDEAIAPLVEVLRPLRLAGLLPSTLHAFNGLRLLGAVTGFPYDRHDGRTSLDRAHPGGLAGLLREHRLPAWAASCCFGGPPDLVRSQLRHLRRAVRRVRGARVVAMTSARAMRLRRWAQRLRWLPGARRAAELCGRFATMARLQEGVPSYDTLTGGRWRSREDAPDDGDPLAGGAGMYWVSPLLPMTGEAVREIMGLCRPLFHRHGFEYQVTFSITSDRALCGVTTIAFDRNAAEERRRARDCHDELVDGLGAAGFIPYRTSVPTFDRLRPAAPIHLGLLRRLGSCLDPAGVLAAGKWR